MKRSGLRANQHFQSKGEDYTHETEERIVETTREERAAELYGGCGPQDWDVCGGLL